MTTFSLYLYNDHLLFVWVSNLQQQNTPTKKIVNGQTVDVPPQLNDEEYQQAVKVENKNYEDAKKDLQERKDNNQKELDIFLKDPFQKQKKELEKRKKARKKAQTRNKAERRKARKVKLYYRLKCLRVKLPIELK